MRWWLISVQLRLDFVLPLKLRQNWLVSWKTRKVYEQNDVRLITRCCEWNNLQCHKNANFMLLETVPLALTRRNMKWLLMWLENHFKSKQICFYSNLGKVFQLPEFPTKLFFKQNWVGGLREAARKCSPIRPNPALHESIRDSCLHITVFKPSSENCWEHWPPLWRENIHNHL